MGKLNPGLMTSATDEWYTPQSFFDILNDEFHFTLDPCATPESAKCERYFTKETNGLARSWQGERVFMNPPYGPSIKDWMKKAFNEALRGAERRFGSMPHSSPNRHTLLA